MAFPASPADGATTLVNGVTYVYSLANVAWSPVASVNSLAVSALSVSGNSSVTGTETVGTSVVTGNESVGGNETVTGNQIVLGNLGVGTSSPGQKLSVLSTGMISYFNSTTTDGYIRVDETGGSANVFGGLSGVGFVGTSSNYPFTIRTNNAERMRIDSSGNVGIGTTNPSNKLQVLTGGAGTDGILVASSGGQFVHMRANNSSGANNALVSTGDQSITFGGNGIDTGSLCIVPWASSASGIKITASGNVGITNSPSGLARLEVKNIGAQNVAYFKNWSGTAASPSENADWPWPVLSLSAYGNFYLQRMLTFSLPNDGQSQGGGTYITDDSVWNISLNGVTTTGWDNNSNLTPVNSSSSSVGLQLMGPGNLRLGTQNAQAVVIRTSNIDRVTVNANGYVSIPNQPAFYADTGSTGTWTTYNCASNNTNYVLIFTNGRTNVNSHYNTGNGFFTAPVAGRYFFGGQVYTQGGQYHRVQLIKSDGQTVLGHTYISQDMTVSVSGIFYMNANDSIGLYATLYDQNFYMGAVHSFFYGHLIG